MKGLGRSEYIIFVFLPDMIKMIPFHAGYLFLTAVVNAFWPTVQALAIAGIWQALCRGWRISMRICVM